MISLLGQAPAAAQVISGGIMSLYDGIVGIDEAALNQFVQSVYQALHDVALKGTVKLAPPELGVAAIKYDVASVPRVSLSPSALVRQHYRTMLAAMNVAAESIDSAAAAQAQASFGLSIETLLVSLDDPDGATIVDLQMPVEAGLEVTVETGNVMTPTVTELVITVPGDPIISQVVNKVLVPELTDSINTFLERVRVPLTVDTVQVSAPAIVTGEGRLLATTALAPAVAEAAPPQGGWPQGVAFAGIDTAAADALLDAATAGKPVTGAWKKTYELWPISVTVNADYRVAASQFATNLTPGQDGQLRGTAQLNGTARLWGRLFSATADVSAVPTVEATASISGNELQLKLDRFDNVKLTLNVHNFPPILNSIISDIVNALSMEISSALTSLVAGLPPSPIAKIPSIPISVDRQTAVITLQTIDVTTIQTSDGKTLLAMTGAPDVTVNPPMPQHIVNIVPQLAAANAYTVREH
jgi:hypothetical protein